MSSPAIRAIRAQKSPFIPHQPEMVSIGRTSCWLYRKVDENMSDPEKALAFQHNKTALAGADLDQRARILTLADRLNLMLTAEAGLADWERKLSKNWSNFQYLTILSWHNDKGDRINDTTTAGDTSVLLPVQMVPSPIVVRALSSSSAFSSSWTSPTSPSSPRQPTLRT